MNNQTIALNQEEIKLILGAIDTHECELLEQENPKRDKQELDALLVLANKLGRLLLRLEAKHFRDETI